MVLRQDRDQDRLDVVDEATSPPAERAFGIGLVIGALLVVGATLFVAQNHDATSLSWLFFDWEMPLWIALLGAIVAGFVAYPLTVSAIRRARARSERRTEATNRLRRTVRSSDS